MKEFFKKYKTMLLKLFIVLAVLIILGLIIFAILYFTGVFFKGENGFELNVELFKKITNSFWGICVYILIQVIITVVLSFAPGGSLEFILLSSVLFSKHYVAFLVSLIGVILSSTIMYLIGYFGGEKFIIWLVGEKDYKKSLNLLQNKGKAYLPLMYLFPIFPDDALCLVAGMSKLGIIYHTIIVILFRGIGIATITFGLKLIPFGEFNHWLDYFILISVVAFWTIIAFFIAHKFSIYLEKRGKK